MGFPPHRNGSLPNGGVSYDDVCCPNAEQAHLESVAITHRLFLGEREEMEWIAAAVAKVIGHLDELSAER